MKIKEAVHRVRYSSSICYGMYEMEEQYRNYKTASKIVMESLMDFDAWHSPAEKLPEVGNPVMIVIKKSFVYTGELVERKYDTVFSIDECYDDARVQDVDKWRYIEE